MEDTQIKTEEKKEKGEEKLSIEVINVLGDLVVPTETLEIGKTIQSSVNDMISATRKMSYQLVSARDLLSYKPAKPSTESKPLWDFVSNTCGDVFISFISLVNVEFEFITIFKLLSSSMAVAKTDLEAGMSFPTAMIKVNNEIEKFVIKQKNFNTKCNELLNIVNKNLKEATTRLVFEKNYNEAQDKLETYQKDYLSKLAALAEFEKNAVAKLSDLNYKRETLIARSSILQENINHTSNKLDAQKNNELNAQSVAASAALNNLNTTSEITENRTSSYTVWHGWWIFGGYKTHYNNYTVNVPNPAKAQANAREEAAKRLAAEMSSQVDNMQKKKESWLMAKAKADSDLKEVGEELSNLTTEFQKKRDYLLNEVMVAKKTLDSTRKTIQDTLTSLDIQEGNVKAFLKASASLPDLLLEQATESIMLTSNVECFSGMLYQHFKGAEDNINDVGSVSDALGSPKYALLKNHQSAIEQAIGDLSMPIGDVRTLLSEGEGLDELLTQVDLITKLNLLQKTSLKGLLSIRKLSDKDQEIQRQEIKTRIGHFYQITGVLVPALITGMKRELEYCTKHKQITNTSDSKLSIENKI